MKLPELLAPAGNSEKLKIALHYGADAIYLGMSEFSLRALAGNFDPDNIKKGAQYIHKMGKKLYITVNIFPHNKDIGPIKEHLQLLKEIGPDGIIVSDFGIFNLTSEIAPDIPIHISTQANITNYMAAKFWEKSGAKRLVLSRELSLDEIKIIRNNVSIELECFVHGALCISYAGRCYMSSFLSNRSANRGMCANSCRWKFALMEETRDGEYFPVFENERGTYIMSSRDICMINHIEQLVNVGVDSLKIEGRMKGINYVASVVKTYREAIDQLEHKPYEIKKEWIEELSKISNRGYSTGLYLGDSNNGYNHDDKHSYRMTHELVGVVNSLNDNMKASISLRNNLRIGDTVEFLSKGLENNTLKITEIRDENGNDHECGRNEQIMIIPVIKGVSPNDLIRRKLPTSK